MSYKKETPGVSEKKKQKKKISARKYTVISVFISHCLHPIPKYRYQFICSLIFLAPYLHCNLLKYIYCYNSMYDKYHLLYPATDNKK